MYGFAGEISNGLHYFIGLFPKSATPASLYVILDPVNISGQTRGNTVPMWSSTWPQRPRNNANLGVCLGRWILYDKRSTWNFCKCACVRKCMQPPIEIFHMIRTW